MSSKNIIELDLLPKSRSTVALREGEIGQWFQKWIIVQNFEGEIKQLQQSREAVKAKISASSEELSREISATHRLRREIMAFEIAQKSRVEIFRGNNRNLKFELKKFELKREYRNREIVLNGELAYGDGLEARWEIDTVDEMTDKEDIDLSKDIRKLKLHEEMYQGLLKYEETMYRILDTAMRVFASEAQLSTHEATVWKLTKYSGRSLFEESKEELEVSKANVISWMEKEIQRRIEGSEAQLGSDHKKEEFSHFGRRSSRPMFGGWNQNHQLETSGDSDFVTGTEIPTVMESSEKESGGGESAPEKPWKSIAETPTLGYSGIPWDEMLCFKCGATGHEDSCCPSKLETSNSWKSIARSPTLGYSGIPWDEKYCFKCGASGHEDPYCPSETIENCKYCGKDDHTEEKCGKFHPKLKKKVCYHCAEEGHVEQYCWYLYSEKRHEFHETKCSFCGRHGHFDENCYIQYPHLKTKSPNRGL